MRVRAYASRARPRGRGDEPRFSETVGGTHRFVCCCFVPLRARAREYLLRRRMSRDGHDFLRRDGRSRLELDGCRTLGRMADDVAGIEQIEAMLYVAGLKDQDTVKSILEMVTHYAGKSVIELPVMRVDNGTCICAKLPDEVRRRLSALYSANDFPRTSKKVCTDCGMLLPRMEFHRNPGTKDGRQSACKECRNRRERKLRVARRLARGGAIIEPEWFESDPGFGEFE